MKLAIHSVDPVTATLGRLGVGAALLFLVAKRQGLELAVPGLPWAHLAGVAVLGNALPFFLIAAAEQRVDSGLAAILIGLTPLATLVLAHFATADEKLTAARAGGVGLGLAGVVVLMGPQALEGLGEDLAAQLLLLAAALCFAANAVIARRMGPQPVARSGLWSCLIGAAVLFPFAVAAQDGGAASLTSIAGILLLGAISTAGAALLFFTVVRDVGANFASTANYFVPLVGVGLGAAVLAERPGWNALAALALIVAGTWLAYRRGG